MSSYNMRPVHAAQITDWSVQPSQTMTCLYLAGGPWKACQAIYADVKLDTVDNNPTQDYYQVVLRVYDYNSSFSTQMQVTDYDGSISFNSPNPGGIVSAQPQSQTIYSQNYVTLTY